MSGAEDRGAHSSAHPRGRGGYAGRRHDEDTRDRGGYAGRRHDEDPRGRGGYAGRRHDEDPRGRGGYAGRRHDEDPRGRGGYAGRRHDEDPRGRGGYAGRRHDEDPRGRGGYAGRRHDEDPRGRGGYAGRWHDEDPRGRGGYAGRWHDEDPRGRGGYAGRRHDEDPRDRGGYAGRRHDEDPRGRGGYAGRRHDEDPRGRGEYAGRRHDEDPRGRGGYAGRRHDEDPRGRGGYEGQPQGQPRRSLNSSLQEYPAIQSDHRERGFRRSAYSSSSLPSSGGQNAKHFNPGGSYSSASGSAYGSLPERSLQVRPRKSVESTRNAGSAHGAPSSSEQGSCIIIEKNTIRANFFRVKLLDNLVVYQYGVCIKKCCPPEPPKHAGACASGQIDDSLPRGCKYRVFEEFCKQYKDIVALYDGDSKMYTTAALPYGSGEIQTVTLERLGARENLDKFSFSVGEVAQLRDISQQEMVQALDIALRRVFCETRTPIGRLLFNETSAMPTHQAGLVFGEGLFTSLRICRDGHFVNADVTRAIFYQQLPLPKLMEALRGKKFKPNQTLDSDEVSSLSTALQGVSIHVTHLPHPCKYVIKSLTANALCTKFILKDRNASKEPTDKENRQTKSASKGQDISVAEYFGTRYGKTLSYPLLPCIDVGKNRYLPIEVCTVSQLQKADKCLKDPKLVDRVKNECLLKPQEKFQAVIKAVEGVAANPTFKSFFADLSASPEALSFTTLPAFTAPLDSEPLKVVEHWIIVDACTKRLHESCIAGFARKLIEKGSQLGVEFRPHRTLGWNGPLATLETIKKKFPHLQILFIILDKDSSPHYSAIKCYAETMFGLITQCILKYTIQKFLVTESLTAKEKRTFDGIIFNVMLKVKAKMGGAYRVMQDCVNRKVKLDDTMIIGADVSHPGPGETDKPSVAAIVASIDKGASRYVATFRVQAQGKDSAKRVEIIEDMKNVARELLQAYTKARLTEPKHIIFYRDGVSEGQFSQVQQSELSALRDACRGLTAMPKITFLTVQKRHKTRFLGEEGNIEPGTVVDQIITHPGNANFYLCSHRSLRGTARPAHYYVICDENDFSADDLHNLSYRLCHVYARCLSPVSIPAPVYYAHHAATRAVCYLNVQGEESMTVKSKTEVPENPDEQNPPVLSTFQICKNIEDKMFFI